MENEYEVPAHHEQHLEHEAEHGIALSQQIAIFTAVLATMGAIVSYLGGHTQNEALYYKNEAVLKRAEASDQWAYYQAKSIKQQLAENEADGGGEPARAASYRQQAARYARERDAIRDRAEALEAESATANSHSEHALHPHERLALAMTLIQIAISAASITALTRKRWLFGLAVTAAVAGVGMWIAAFAL